MSAGLRITPFWDQRLATLLLRVLVPLRIHPNAVTGFTMVCACSALWLYAQGEALWHWGAVFFVVAMFLDHVDGQLARATGKTSRLGYHLDHIASAMTYATVFIGMGLGLGDDRFAGWGLPLGTNAGLAIAVIFSVRIGAKEAWGPEAAEQPNVLGFEMEDIMYVVAPVTWFGVVDWFVLAAAFGAPIYLIIQVIVYLRRRGATSD